MRKIPDGFTGLVGSLVTDEQREYIKMYLMVNNFAHKRFDKVAIQHRINPVHLQRVVDGRVKITGNTLPALLDLLALTAERCNAYMARGGLMTHFETCNQLGISPATLVIPSKVNIKE